MSTITPSRTFALPPEARTIGSATDFNALAMLLLGAKGSPGAALRRAEAVTDAGPRVVAALKAAVAAGTTFDGSWAGPLVDYQIVTAGFVASLAASGIFDRLLPDMMRLPMNTRFASVTAAATGSSPAEKTPKPISRMSLKTEDMERRKAATLVVVTEEVARLGGPDAMRFIGNELKRGTIVASDGTFLAGIAAGVTPIPGSGGDAIAVVADIGKLLAAVDIDQLAKLYLIVPTAMATKLTTLPGNIDELAFDMLPVGGTIAGITVLASDALPADRVLLVNAARVAANSDQVTLDASESATIELADNPIDGAKPDITVPIVSLSAGSPAIVTVSSADIGKFYNGQTIKISGADAEHSAANGNHKVSSVGSPANSFAIDADTSSASGAQTVGLSCTVPDATGAAATVTSLWHANMRALRSERWFGFHSLPRSVSVLQPCSWGSTP